MAKKSGKNGKAAPKRKPAKVVAKKPNRTKADGTTKPQVAIGNRRISRPAKLPNVWRLSETAAKTLWQHKGLFGGLTLVYGLLNIILAQGLSSISNVSSLRQTLSQASHGHFATLNSGVSGFFSLIGSASTNSSSGSYQFFLGLIASLAIIWSLRQVLATTSSTKLRVRDGFYRGMYPLVPFILVLLLVGLQLLPLLIGSTVYGLVINNGIAVLFIEKLIFTLIYAALAFWSLYMISASLFALYIVSLPDMTPIKALRSARELVRRRRWTTLRKILALPLFLLIIAAIIMLPIIIWLTVLAPLAFFLLTMFGLTAVHAYMYTLYRELLNE